MKTDENSSPYDPLEVARREGQILGLGLKGGYSRNKVVRIGFILIGGSLFLMGLVFLTSLFFFIVGDGMKDEIGFYNSLIIFATGLGLSFLGGAMFIRNFRNNGRVFSKKEDVSSK